MDIKKDIIDKIKKGELKKRPKIYFALRTAFVILATILLFVISIFSVSFIFYILRESNIRFLPMFGRPGLLIFFLLFPWTHVLVALVFTFIIGWLLRRYSFAYRKPLLYLPVIIIALITLASIALHIISFHERFSRFARKNDVPVFGQFYRAYRGKDFDSSNIAVVRDIVPDGSGRWQAITDNGTKVYVYSSASSSGMQENFPEPLASMPVPGGLKDSRMAIIFGPKQGNAIQERMIKIIRNTGAHRRGFWEGFWQTLLHWFH